MQKVLGIFLGPHFPGHYWDEDDAEGGIGGNETWALEIAKEFATRGYEVILYGYPKSGHYVRGYDNFYIAYYDELNTHIKEGKYFDYFIYVRHTDRINPYLNCPSVYGMAPDVKLWTDHSINVGAGRVKKWGSLSAWHTQNLLKEHAQLGMKEDQILRVTNGCSMQYYQDSWDYDHKKSNSIVWSSGLYRGFFELYEHVLWPIIKDTDLTIHVCIGTPQNQMELIEQVKILPRVIYHGVTSKKELSNLQKNAKAWVYNGIFPETFCITAVENGMARTALLCPPSYGLGSTLEGYDFQVEDILSEKNYSQWEQILRRILVDDEYRLSLANSAFSVVKKYTWRYAADLWEQEFNNCNGMPPSQYL